MMLTECPPPQLSAGFMFQRDQRNDRKKSCDSDEFRKRSGTVGSGKGSEKRWPKRDVGPSLELRFYGTMLTATVFFEDEQVRINGSVFTRRTNYDNLLSVVPKSKFNGIHIKMEDDCPQGGDDIRLCLLKTLGANNLRSVPCVCCYADMKVYDKYPLLDGVFYLSSVSQYGAKTEVFLDGRKFFLQQLCVKCLWSDWFCRTCGQGNWFAGRAIILGTLYYYDILSAGRCCPPSCKKCKSPLLVRDQLTQQLTNVGTMGNYASINEPLTCSACGAHDFHLVRDLRCCALSAVDPNKP
ncbi:unnamed protein product [Caenorhabditis auriculariae]|uniref:Headcase middle domain-containing protein n=1 Tax=Caenorhabditis auriculariae TaxID=2777116 RepID=A0A8S1HR55_9PELO|nr:unnamed protein product [Caenorhabditis auriculariae]